MRTRVQIDEKSRVLEYYVVTPTLGSTWSDLPLDCSTLNLAQNQRFAYVNVFARTVIFEIFLSTRVLYEISKYGGRPDSAWRYPSTTNVYVCMYPHRNRGNFSP